MTRNPADAEDLVQDTDGAPAPGTGRDPAEEVLARLPGQELHKVLSSLSAANLRVVLLANVEGYSYKERSPS